MTSPVDDELIDKGEFTATPSPQYSAPPHATDAPAWRKYFNHIRFGLAAILVIVAVGMYFGGRSNSAGASEIIRESADTPGNNVFTPSVAAASPAPVAAATATPPQSSQGLVRANGDAPGLYAGQRDVPSCNAGALVGYLTANPGKASAWAGAAGIPTDGIKGFVDSLTSVVLRVDTRVTEFQFGGGKAIAKQAVLQSGTAVFVDRTGFPRVRCASGNPLTEPRSVPSAPTYTGPAWPGFSPSSIVVITPAAAPVALVLIDLRNGNVFVRIPGSIILLDIDRPAVGIAIIIVEPGGPFTVTGSQFPPGTAITITFDDPATTLATPTADGGGNFSVRVNAPPTARPGIHQVTITGGGVTLTQPVYVLPIAR
jgi:hypothetical protein